MLGPAGLLVHRVAAEQLVGAVAGQHHLDAQLADAANSGTDTIALMMSPYSVSSDSRIASRTSASLMSPGARR